MKINKLFHWLYAILMLLPVVLFIPTAFYYGFNHDAQAQERTIQEPTYYGSNEVTSKEDLLLDNVYTWENNIGALPATSSTSVYFNITILNGIHANKTGTFYKNESGNIVIYVVPNDIVISSIAFDFILNSYGASFGSIPIDVLEKISICEHQYIKGYAPVTYTMSIVQSMSNALETTMDVPLMAWAKTSFLVTPFQYISGLFGLSVDNPINTLLSYWLSISIIWLVFDVVMYVPLLVHKWIDKGVIS